jgi:hypothetical protein
MRRLLLAILGTMAFMMTTVGAQTPSALPTGTPQQGTATSDKPAEYAVTAKTAGVLTVAVQGSGDLMIQVLDGDGQVLPNGAFDRDLNGNEGSELASATLTEAGAYRVRVRVQSGTNSTFQIAGSFLAFPLFERAGDPDRRPGTAKAIQVGRAFEDALDPSSGDSWDWFVMKLAEAGTLTVVTRQLGTGDGPDLILEVFTNNEFATPAARSDQDLQGNTANESVSVQVAAGQSVHVRVANNFSSRPAQYRLSSSLAP